MFAYSTRQPRRALSGDGQPPDDPASAFRHPPVLGAQADQKAALALAVFRCSRDQDGVARIGGRSGWVVRSSPTRLKRAFVDRQDASPAVFGPPGGCDRRNRFARAHGGSSQFERCRLYLAARCGSCTDASFGAVFRYPLIRLSRGPAGRGVLPSYGEASSSSFPRESARPAALLGFCPSQFCSRWRVVAPHECGG